MLFDSIDEMKKDGFQGFETIGDLMENGCENVPDKKGVLFVIHQGAKPIFLAKNDGESVIGRPFKYSPDDLEKNWIDKTNVVYIGESKQLQRRLKNYMRLACKH